MPNDVEEDIIQDSGNPLGSDRDQENQGQTSGLTSAFLKLKEHGRFSRTRAMRLKPDDVIVAIDGQLFKESSDILADMLSEEEVEYWIVTIYRSGGLFEVATRGPLGGTFEYCKSEEIEQIEKLLLGHKFHEKNQYKIYEVLKDIKKNCDLYDTSYNRLAVYAPPLWLIQERMWEPLIAIAAVYLITINVSLILFLIAAILISVYLKRGQVTLRRSYSMYQDRQVWVTVAAINERDAQTVCRILDPKCKFSHSLVGPPAKDAPKKKKKKRSGDLRVAV